MQAIARDNSIVANGKTSMDLQIRGEKAIMAGFVVDADGMAPMAALLCSPLSRFIVGQNIVIDGGQHHSLF